MSVIETVEQLEAIYGATNDASTVKVADHVTPLYRVFIEKAPFAALATIGPEGIDCSPRGDVPYSGPAAEISSEHLSVVSTDRCRDDGVAVHSDFSCGRQVGIRKLGA